MRPPGPCSAATGSPPSETSPSTAGPACATCVVSSTSSRRSQIQDVAQHAGIVRDDAVDAEVDVLTHQLPGVDRVDADRHPELVNAIHQLLIGHPIAGVDLLGPGA